MSNVLNRTTREYRLSVNTPDYPVQDWIRNPDLSAVAGFPSIYWVITGDIVSLMTPGERDAVDAAAATARKNAIADELDHVETIMRAFAEALLDELNTRAVAFNALLTAIDNGASLAAIKTAVAAINDTPTRTLAQLKTAVRSKL